MIFFYFAIGLFTCNIPVPLVGMFFGAPSVMIGAIILALILTLEMCLQRDCKVDYQESMDAFCYLGIIIAFYIIFLLLYYW
ncbi:hypothetical protein COMX_08620 [Commensalibacter papalotli (ex Servin-Garciduenas et al. 2014)]|uniref:Uncharacterized protein n=1 Tax=Commensalibacter papalotli (ex Servin-Garciduenas et al. 2014) TaxID=1208583 RepID=W7DUV1_9PROT|nr:hypothetical protein COMX_08620 [Commensalibacter papalotli (ex Servin-Garciduenas et al. 2014)]